MSFASSITACYGNASQWPVRPFGSSTCIVGEQASHWSTYATISSIDGVIVKSNAADGWWLSECCEFRRRHRGMQFAMGPASMLRTWVDEPPSRRNEPPSCSCLYREPQDQ